MFYDQFDRTLEDGDKYVTGYTFPSFSTPFHEKQRKKYICKKTLIKRKSIFTLSKLSFLAQLSFFKNISQ